MTRRGKIALGGLVGGVVAAPLVLFLALEADARHESEIACSALAPPVPLGRDPSPVRDVLASFTEASQAERDACAYELASIHDPVRAPSPALEAVLARVARARPALDLEGAFAFRDDDDGVRRLGVGRGLELLGGVAIHEARTRRSGEAWADARRLLRLLDLEPIAPLIVNHNGDSQVGRVAFAMDVFARLVQFGSPPLPEKLALEDALEDLERPRRAVDGWRRWMASRLRRYPPDDAGQAEAEALISQDEDYRAWPRPIRRLFFLQDRARTATLASEGSELLARPFAVALAEARALGVRVHEQHPSRAPLSNGAFSPLLDSSWLTSEIGLQAERVTWLRLGRMALDAEGALEDPFTGRPLERRQLGDREVLLSSPERASLSLRLTQP